MSDHHRKPSKTIRIVSSDLFYFLAQIEYKEKFLCGGVIISSKAVLTARQCLFDNIKANYRVRVGATSKSEKGYLFPVEKFITHPYFNDTTLDYDFALLLVSVSCIALEQSSLNFFES